MNIPTPACPTTRAAVRGFTLIEVLLALAIGSVLVTSVASGLQLFGKELEYVRDEPDARLEEVVVQITERVRDAWWADVPSSNELQVSDPQGNVTTYEVTGGQLVMTRPSGETGVLLDDVASASFSAETVQRLRDEPTIVVDGPWFSKAKPTGPDIEVVLTAGDALALGFHASDDAPLSVSTVDDVQEERLSVKPDRITLTMSFMDGNLKEFCHLHATYPHDPAHPGYPGNRLIADLYEARSPDDARPYGPKLASIDIPATDLPPMEWVWWDTTLNEQAYPPDAEDGFTGTDKCIDNDGDGECDFPGKKHHHNPLDAPDGVAWGWWSQHEDVVLIVTPANTSVDVDLSQFGVSVEPGRAYCVVLSVDGWDEVRVLATPTFTSSGSGVAYMTSSGTFQPQALGIPMTLSGEQVCTQTAETDAISRVTLDVTLADGRQLSASSAVQGQVAILDPWRGVVPNQVGDVGP